MNEKNKKLKTSKLIKAIILIIIVSIVAIYVTYEAIKLIQEPTDTLIVENGKISKEETVTGYIIREETIVKGENYKNGILKIKTEGERVAEGDSVFRYYNKKEDKLVEELEKLDEQIQEALESENNNIFSSDIVLLEQQIEDKMQEIYELNDIEEINKIKKEIDTYITKKARIAGDLSPAGSYIRTLTTKRNEIASELNSGSEYITAPASGLVSYKIDGFEEILTSSDFSYLSKDFLNGLDLKTGKAVENSNEGGKIINNFNCYIATILNSEEAMQTKVGNKIKIQISNESESTAEVVFIKEEENSRIIVLKITQNVEKLIEYRKLSFDVIWWNFNGLKVPNSALIYENDKAYVIRTRARLFKSDFS